jgi:hypothetical protein
MRQSRLFGVLCAVVLTAAGCVNVTAGTAVRADPVNPRMSDRPSASARPGPGPGPGVGGVLLSVADVNTIMNATDMELMDSADDMADHRSDISDPQCLGALYNAEESVYEDTGWTDVADQVITEPDDDSSHWVEQTAVRFPSADRAAAFVKSSANQWEDCIGKSVVVDDGEYEFNWIFEGISIDNGTISQKARQTDSDGWACDHAMAAAADVVVEASVCGPELQDEAVAVVGKLVGNVR